MSRSQVPGCHVSRLLNCTVEKTFDNIARLDVGVAGSIPDELRKKLLYSTAALSEILLLRDSTACTGQES